MINYNHQLIDPLLKFLPVSPGVYIYKNSSGKVIYVGKAVNLKRRVSSYFQRDDALGPKTQQLVSHIAQIDFHIVDSEIEALILESSLIKKYKPKFNSMLKDDRSYVYICITKGSLPLVFSAHKSNLPENAYIYGPFPNAAAVKSLLKTLRRIFPYRSRAYHPKGQCLYCHIGLCPGENPDPVGYKRTISKIKKVLSGKLKSLTRELEKEMKAESKDENYESALVVRKQLESLKYIISGWFNLSNLFEKTNLPDDDISNALSELHTTLHPYFPFLKSINRIECFDISQMGTRHFVGSMTVFLDGIIDHKEYRKFKIYSKVTPDDQFMMREVVWRRLKHSEWGMPDILVVDGGKPQVSSIKKIFDILEIKDIALIGLAKKFETIVIKSGDDFKEINLPASSSALKLLQQLRDEAHRFANRYRKELMKKSISA
ncbi:MAG TPA: GIY-YIG nuclease family protein [Patescibacteria group bacterium]